MIKILHVITGLGIGGAETALYRLLQTMDEAEFSHQVVSLTGQGVYGGKIVSLGIPVHALDMPAGRLTWHGLHRLRKLIHGWQPNIVHAWMYHAHLVAWLAQKRGVQIWGVRQSPLDWQQIKKSTRWVIQLNARLARAPRPQVIVVNAQSAISVHGDLGFPEEKMRYLPNGFDTQVFKPDEFARRETRKRLALDASTPLIGLFARFHPQKGHAVFFSAARKVLLARPEVHFLLCGQGVTLDNPQIRDWLPKDSRQQSFHLMGACERMPAWYAALDGLVLSSLMEGFPNVLGEAMACGVPCVGTDVGDTASIIGETGWVVPPGRAEDLAEAMLSLLNLPEDGRRILGAQARKRIEDLFSLERMTALYADLYRSLL